MKQDSVYSSPPPSHHFYSFGRLKGLLTHLLFVFAGIKRVLSLKVVLQGCYKDDLQYYEVPLVELIPLPVSVDGAMVLAAPSAVRGKGSATQVDPGLVGAPIGGVPVMILFLWPLMMKQRRRR